MSIIDQIAFDQIADERDKAQQENKLLKQRIKRLEEAGDGLSMWVCPEYKSDPANIALKHWKQAKEAKP